MSSSKFKRTSQKGGIKAVKDRVKKSGTVDVGIIDAGTHDSGDLTVAQIGFQHEFGTSSIPERSFIRSTLQDQKKEIRTRQKRYMSKIILGDLTTESGLKLLGQWMAAEIKDKIVKIRTPPNSPRTIAIKGSSNPLIHTEQMKNSVTYEVNA